jgi:hypothetical protein
MANISGSWLGTYWQFGQPTRFELTLVQGGNVLSGNILDDSHLGEADVNGEIIGRKINFTKSYFNARHQVYYQGILAETEDFISGKWIISNFNSGTWEAIKKDDELDLNQELRRYQKIPANV